MLHVAVVRSPFAHATISGIDTGPATEVPGVVAVYTATDLCADRISLPNAWSVTSD
jgi:carbon-monoxide dehydrogenase large subunit